MLKSLEGEAHIWLAVIKKNYPRKFIEGYEAILSEDEIKKYKSFYFEHHRKSYLISHALLRTTLSRYKNIPPEEWTFSYNAKGRPEIHKPENKSKLRFNLSRTENIAACLITSAIDAGIDVENAKNLNDIKLLSEYVLSPQEITSLQGLSAQILKERFLTYWTLKEAYVKALGIGLSIPLTQLAFKLNIDGKAQIVLDPQHSGSLIKWQFAYFNLLDEHVLAVAFRKNDNVDFKIKINVITPELLSY